jgi:DNA-directed RNA polymerase subunit RPC12/RpoP
MTSPGSEERYDAVCPHCHKEFTAELLEGSSERHRGFKCPHCKLFVPHERAQSEVETPAPS